MFVARLYEWLFLFHILAAMVWVGGALLLAVIGSRALRSGDAAEVGRFVRGLRTTGPLVLAPADAGDDAGAFLQLRRWRLGYLAMLALLLVTAWDMVFKP